MIRNNDYELIFHGFLEKEKLVENHQCWFFEPSNRIDSIYMSAEDVFLEEGQSISVSLRVSV